MIGDILTIHRLSVAIAAALLPASLSFSVSAAPVAGMSAPPALSTSTTVITTSTDDDTEHLVISGSRSAQPAIDVPAAIEVISADDIRRSGAATLAQVLAARAGLQLADNIGNGGRGVSIGMRGFGENGVNNVLVLVDGRRLNNPSMAAPDLASIALQDIERIEILHGSAGALYGDQAVAGVINIITRRAQGRETWAELARGSDDLERYRGVHGEQYDSGFFWRLSGEKLLADNFRDNNEQHSHNAQLRAGFEQARWSLQAQHQQGEDDLRLPGSLDAAQARVRPRATTTPDNFGNRDLETSHLAGRAEVSAHWQFEADWSARDDRGHGAFFGTPYRYQTETTIQQPRARGRYPLTHGDLVMTVGLDREDADFFADYGFGATDIRQSLDDQYVQLSWPAAPAIDVSAGARRSEFRFARHNGPQDYRNDLDAWQAGANWQLAGRSRLFLRRDEAFRWPNADENGFLKPDVDHLQPQQSASWELGYETAVDLLQFSAVLYRMNVDNEILFDPFANGPWGPGTGANVNFDAARREGVNLSTRWTLQESLQLRFDYSWVSAELRGGVLNGKRVPHVARDRAVAALDWQWASDWSLHADLAWTGERYRAGDAGNLAGRLPGYALLNLALRWQGEALYGVLRINNAADRRYNSYHGGLPPFDYVYPGAGRQLEASVGYRF